METSASVLVHANELYARSSTSSSSDSRPPVYKAIGISLAVASGLFIGVSFVLKKTGLLKANVKYNEEAGEGYGYLKNFWWWSGMTLMIIGEICNFVAYAFVDAILVTPLGALSVVITTILSAIFLKERLSFVGKVGCFSCIIGSVVIAMNAPEQSSVNDIQDMQHYVIAPGFLSYAGVIIVGCAFLAFWAGPRYGKKNMFVYISICSLIGGLSVVATQGLGAAILAQIRGVPQFKQWFLYVLFVFVVATLLTEIIFLNKALNIFNAALVTPTYYVLFTSATIITSAILFRGFKGSAVQITTVIMGFLQICAGVVLLQLSKSAKDVPDAAVFKGDLDQIREVGEQEEPELEPKADAIRGTAAILRRISTSRQKMEAEEARRYFRERQEDHLRPPSENEIIEWDGLRRRKTIIGQGPTMARPRTPGTPVSARTLHPPLGMSHFPEDEEPERPSTKQSGHSFFGDVVSRASSVLHPTQWRSIHEEHKTHSPLHPVALTDISVHPNKGGDTAYHGAAPYPGADLDPPFQPRLGRERSDTPRSISWADENHQVQSPTRGGQLAPEQTPNSARRQFSFQNVFHRSKTGEQSPRSPASPVRGILRRGHRTDSLEQRRAMKHATEEERLGLVKGDSRGSDGEDSLDEKLQRTLSSSSDSSVEDLVPRPVHFSRPHQPSVSTASTTTFPAYEEPPHYGEVEHYYMYPPSQQVASPIGEALEHSWQMPHVASTAHDTTDASRPHVVPARRPNPLPRIPSEESAAGESAEPYTRVELRSPDLGYSSSDHGVASLSSSQTSSNSRGRRESGWRRAGHRYTRGDSASSGSSNEDTGGGRRQISRDGAFL
ncbi:hypothetical protein DTO195F2_2157 [Paecilomyces variotii]|nr:hypothetical protein DTO195F2_2157 [Paecilomyces variotii]